MSREPLTQEQIAIIEEQLPVHIERELKRRVQQILTDKVLDDFGYGVEDDGPRQPLWESVINKDRLLILGKPGAGKTTSLRHITLRYLAEETVSPSAGTLPQRLPILVSVREFGSSQREDLLSFIKEEFSIYGFKNSSSVVNALLKSTLECSILVDGLDEVPRSQQAKVVEDIGRLSRRFANNQYIVTCRTANYQGQLERFSEVEIADFGHVQVTEFVRHWFIESPPLANRFLEEISRKPGLQELTKTPLLLAMLCIAFRRHQRFPEQKAYVYLACLDALLLDWDASKGVRRESFVEGFDPESKKIMLSKIACDTYCDGALFFTREDIERRFEEQAENLSIRRKSGQLILSEFEENHGLVVERAHNLYSFSHLTIQEFLCAFHLARCQHEVHCKLVDELGKDQRWREVVVFLTCLGTNRENILTLVRNKAKSQLKGTSVGLLMWTSPIPQAVVGFIGKNGGPQSSTGWEAWFRRKVFEYNIHKACYGRQNKIILPTISQGDISRGLAHFLSINPYDEKGVLQKKSVNYSIAESIRSQDKRLDPNIMAKYSQQLGDYVFLAGVLVEALASGSHVRADFKRRVALDLTYPNTDPWPDNPPRGVNRLGA